MQRQEGQDSQLPEQPGQIGLVAPVAGLENPHLHAQNANLSESHRPAEYDEKRFSRAARVAPSNPVPATSSHANFEANSYSWQPQKYNYRELWEEYFKKLSWAASSKERMTVLFSALRLALGDAPGKADFSGVQALVNEYGCKLVLAGIMATIGRELERQAYFIYLRGVVQRQQQEAASAPARKYGVTRVYHDQSNENTKRIARLPIDLAKYTGNGKYAHLVAY